MSVHWVPLTAENLSLGAPLWSDRQAYTNAEFAHALTTVKTLLRQRRAIGALVFEAGTVRALGVSAFVDETAIERLLEDGLPQIGKRLLMATDAAQQGGAILDRRRIAEGNANHGLHLQVLNTNLDFGAADTASVLGAMIAAFQELHRGYRLARIVDEVHGERAVDIVVRSRSFVLLRQHADVGGVKGLSSAIGSVTQEQAMTLGTPLLSMFVYTPPRIVFTEPEQELIRAALRGAPDPVLAEQLGVPLTAIKSRWARIQQRALNAIPDALPDFHEPHGDNTRGAQYRHVILDYVRNHPSELTPYPATRRAPYGRADRR